MLVKLDTGFNIEVDFEVAGFFRRLLAWLVDSVVISVYVFLVYLGLAYMEVHSSWAYILAYGVPVFLYYPVCETLMNGKTLGKMATRIQVISQDGGQPTTSQYLIRWAFRLVDLPWWIFGLAVNGVLPWWSFIFMFAGLVCIIATPATQRLGDLAAGTLVIDSRPRANISDTIFRELESDYKPRYPAVMRLTDRDVNTLTSIIETVRKKGNYDLSMRIAERIKSRLQIASDQDSLEFLETLMKDYNYYATR